MSPKNKINFIIGLFSISLVGIFFLVVATKNWMKYSEPIEEKNIQLGIYQATDYPVDGKKSYYYKIVGDVKYSAGNWPNTKSEILRSDTILVLHDCTFD